MKQKSPGCNSNKRLYMPIIMQTQTLCSYILSTITIHTHVHSIALPHGKCSSHIQHLLQYLAHFPKQNKAANHIPYAYQKFSNLLLLWWKTLLEETSLCIFSTCPNLSNYITHIQYNTKIDTPTWYEQYYFEKPHPNFFIFLIIQEWMLDSGTFSILKTK